MAIRRFVGATPIYIILVVIGLFFLIPLLWPILASFNASATLSLALPKVFSLENFSTIIGNGIVVQPFANSLILGISTMLLTVILAGLAAYPLSRYQFRLKRFLMYFILFTSALPVLALVTPLYALYTTLSLQDTLLGCILFFVAGGTRISQR